MFFSPVMSPLVRVTLTYVDAATSTTSSITAPGGIASGDLAIYMDVATQNDGTPTAVTPSGFTNVLSKGQFLEPSGIRGMVSYKVLAGTETTITGMNSDVNTKCMVVYRPSRSIASVAPLTGASWGQEITNSNPSSQATTLASLTPPVIFLGISYGSSSTGAFSTESPSFDATHTAGGSRFGRKLYNISPQNHTIDMNDLGSNALFSGYIRVT